MGSDRREDGDLFLPPDASFSHVKKLQTLTKSEEMIRSERRSLFLSEKFAMGDAGALFPISWRSDEPTAVAPLKSRPEFVDQSLFEKAAKIAVPQFDKCTEDG